jgi:hypothetical protein
MVVRALCRAGCATRAADLIAKFPSTRCVDWTKVAVGALLSGCEEALIEVGRRVDAEYKISRIIRSTALALVREGRAGVAASFKIAASRRSSKRAVGDADGDEGEGVRLAAMLRRCVKAAP